MTEHVKLPAFEGVRYRTFSTMEIQGPMAQKMLALALKGRALLEDILKKFVEVSLYPEGTTFDNMTEKNVGSDILGKFIQAYEQQKGFAESGSLMQFEGVGGKVVNIPARDAKEIIGLWEEQQVFRAHMTRLVTILSNLRTTEYYWDPEKNLVDKRAPIHTLTHDEIEYLGLQVAKEPKT